MRKIIFIIACALFLLGAAGFLVYDVTKDKSEPVVEKTEIVESQTMDFLNVEQARTLDLEYMALRYDDYDGYKWFEDCILMDDWLDSEVEPAVFGTANIFQVQKKVGRNTKCKVVLISHNLVKDTVDIRDGFWVEDFDLNELDFTKFITFDEAYKIFKEANVKKPHSKHVVLRKAIGPNHEDSYNPQYIFGNAECHYYVDAITGEFNTVDPSGIPDDGHDEPYFSFVSE